jgi:hypothetical protein
MTFASARPAFIEKTRQQPFDALVATRISLTPIGSVVGLDNGSKSSTFEDEVQAWSDTDLTQQEIVNRRIPSMTLNP